MVAKTKKLDAEAKIVVVADGFQKTTKFSKDIDLVEQ
jgi:hypothetical protein